MNNYKYSDQPNLKENAEVTRQVAAEGTILLKNDNNTLPFNSKNHRWFLEFLMILFLVEQEVVT
jgi:beta-glucosidase-like glycosyl hydrolase